MAQDRFKHVEGPDGYETPFGSPGRPHQRDERHQFSGMFGVPSPPSGDIPASPIHETRPFPDRSGSSGPVVLTDLKRPKRRGPVERPAGALPDPMRVKRLPPRSQFPS